MGASPRAALRQLLFSPGDLLRDVATWLHPIAEQARVRIETSADEGTLIADPEWIGRAVANLAHNAVRHSPPGERVTLQARLDGGEWRLIVRDHGSGISPEALSGMTAPHGLAGLGLTLVRRIVHVHRGTFQVESDPDHGSTFTIRLANPISGEVE